MSALRDILLHTSASSCVECGKCSAACSMAAMYSDFALAETPRGIVQYALRTAPSTPPDAYPASIWRCLQCGNCTAACPEKVDCAGLIAMLRAEARAAGAHAAERTCPCCGREIMAAPVDAWLRDRLGEPATEEAPLPAFLQKYDDTSDVSSAQPRPAYETLCPACRRQRYAANNTDAEGR